MSTGKRIRAAREAARMTQAEVAEEIGVSAPSIRLYELDKRTPKPEILDKIAKAIGVDPQSLVEVEINSARDALELLFRIEESFGLTPNADGALVINKRVKGSQKLDIAISQWAKMHSDLDEGKITQEEYDSWKACVR